MQIGRDYFIPKEYTDHLYSESFRRRNGITNENQTLFERKTFHVKGLEFYLISNSNPYQPVYSIRIAGVGHNIEVTQGISEMIEEAFDEDDTGGLEGILASLEGFSV